MSVSYNKMSAIKVAGTYVNNVPSGTSLGNVSLDITGKSHFTSDILVDGSFNILNINSSDPVGNFNLANNHTTGNINIGTGLTTGATFISNTTTLNAPITIGSTLSTTQTLDVNAITTFSKIPSTSVAPTISNHLCNKTYVDSVGGSSILGTNNTWTGTNAFNTSLPTSTITGGPFPPGTLTTNSYVETLIALERSNFKAANNTWTGTNEFNTSLPTSTLTPSTSTQLTTKAYVDSVAGGVSLSSNNTWTGTNAFNTSLPTSTLTPSTSTELTTKTYVDSNFCDLLNTQVIAGEKTFTDQTTIGPGTLITTDINSSGLIDCYDIYVNHFLNIGATTIIETGVGDIALNNAINGGKYIFNADDAGGVSREALNLSAATATFYGDITAPSLTTTYISNSSSIDTPSLTSGLQTDDLNVGANQTSGKLFLGCRTNRTGEINIGTLATGNAPINIGSVSSTTQTATHNAISTFNKIPLCAGVPATGDHLTNKTYVDDNFCALTGTQTIGGSKTFSSIISCSVAPVVGSHLCNKTYVDSVAGGVSLGSNNTWTGFNSFNTNLPTSTLTPTTGSQLTTKTYVDSVSASGFLASNNAFTGTNSFTNTFNVNTTGAATTNIGNNSASLPAVNILGAPVSINSTGVRNTTIGNATGSTTITGQATFLGNTQFGDAAADFIVPNGTLTKPFIIGTYASQSSFSLASITPVTTYLGGTLQTSASFGNSATGTFRYVMAGVAPYTAGGGLALTAGTYMMWIGINFEDASAFAMTDLRMGLSDSGSLTAASTEATITGSLPNLTCYYHRTDPTDAATSDSDNIVLSSCFNILTNTTLFPFYVANHSVTMDLVKVDVIFTKIGGP